MQDVQCQLGQFLAHAPRHQPGLLVHLAEDELPVGLRHPLEPGRRWLRHAWIAAMPSVKAA